MTELQEKIFEVMKVFDRVCRENRLQYYMLGGTMLGAVRHKGFIPWDDDADFGLPRNEYERLLSLPPDVFPEGFCLRHFSQESTVPYAFARLENEATTLIEARRSGSGYVGGVYIDIFPLDADTGSAVTRFFQELRIKAEKKLLYAHIADKEHMKNPVKRALLQKIAERTKQERLVQRLDSSVKQFGERKNGFLPRGEARYSNYLGHWGRKESIPRHVFDGELKNSTYSAVDQRRGERVMAPAGGRTAEYEFEGVNFFGPVDADSYLRALYGVNYLTPPPKHRQEGHPVNYIELEQPFQKYQQNKAGGTEMTFEEALKKVSEYGQEHVLQYYEELSPEEKTKLLAQIAQTDFSVLANAKDGSKELSRGVISPIPAMKLDEIEANKEAFTEKGLELLRAGKVGAVLLAGGMGTRLGSDDPKCMYNIGITKEVYIFERLINNLMDVVKQTGSYIHLFVMTSEKNHEKTVKFMNEKKFFGYDPNYVTFFMQDMAPASDYNGKVYMEGRGLIAASPNGNGGWFSSMKRAGLLEMLHKNGIEYLNIFAVDNVLQRIADPAFVGATALRNCVVGAKVIRKNAPDEKVGVMCLEDGKPSIVEYYELTQEMMEAKDASGEPAYNYGVILNYLFRVKELEEIVGKDLPLHIVEKKIPYCNEAGELIKPEKPNGYKYESLVLDMIHMLDSCLVYEVVREKEFAPIKNATGVDSVESARELLRLNGVEL